MPFCRMPGHHDYAFKQLLVYPTSMKFGGPWNRLEKKEPIILINLHKTRSIIFKVCIYSIYSIYSIPGHPYVGIFAGVSHF